MLSFEDKTLKELTSKFAKPGKVELITYRPEQYSLPAETESINVIKDQGLEGDHYAKKGGKRQVTLIQKEHIEAVASIMGMEQIDPKLLRRNIVVSGINLLALKGHRFRIGEAVLEFAGSCVPCSRMEENLGKGGYNAMRGHGGICCKVISGGIIKLGDGVEVIKP